jgi:hypothetical protein
MRTLLSLALLALSLDCSRLPYPEARSLVLRYNEVVSEAYRRGDVRLIDSVVGPNAPDGSRLAGLIGVRVDMGLTLDAHLESLDVVWAEKHVGDLLVRTKEQWRYRDIKTDTGQQVGQASVDHYEMQYHFKSHKGAWLLEETSFAAPPQVGRKETPWNLDAKEAHGMIRPPIAKGSKP